MRVKNGLFMKKDVVAHLRYIVRSTFTRSLVSQEKFWHDMTNVFKLEFLFCQKREDTSSEFE